MKNSLNKLAKSIALIIIALQCNSATCQTADNQPIVFSNDSTVVNQANGKDDGAPLVIENAPEFPCGENHLRKYIAENTVYPEEAKNKGLEGKVFINFLVSKTGEVQDVKVARGIDPLLDNEAIRVVQGMPKWKPGSQRGKPVEVRFTLQISFPPTNNIPTFETKPEYPGGAFALEKYISKQLAKRPKITKKKTGKYRFIINKQGFAENISVVRSINSAIDDMVVSALQNMSQWNCAYFRKDPNQWPVTISITADKYGRLSVNVDTMWVK